LIGSSGGVWLFTFLQKLGQIDLVISLTYVLFLGTIGLMMTWESGTTIRRLKQPKDNTNSAIPGKTKHWLQRVPLPFTIYFPRSNLHTSALLPIGVGILAGALVSLMGIGGGFIMIPAMIYILGMPTSVVVGTSLFQIIFTTSNATILHAINTQSVDIVLSLLLILGGVVGAQFGTRLGMKLPAEKLRGLLGLLVLAVCLRLGMELFLTPDDLYTLSLVEK
ncbi:MAG: sulfite exporter TauE/SafE family protein, partial [Rickettsiales bacterium]|nr:sulfite exporter TauE/SafE family protein [Rickettsiales bacterium]